MDLVEAIADAIQRFEGWMPAGAGYEGSRSWRNRNPGNLRPSVNSDVPVDAGNYRTFTTLADGWFALRADISAKLGGTHGLTNQSTLRNFFDIYAPSGDANNPDQYADRVATWLSFSLGRQITAKTTLGDLKAI
jgi:hypothetical protein